MCAIALKRMLSRPVVEAFIEQAYRIPEEQARTAEVLRTAGYPAADRILDILKQSETIGPRAFLMDALAGMPEASPLIVPLLKSPRPAEVRLAAELLGRRPVPEALGPLVAQANHPDERVRLAVLEALGQLRDKTVTDALRRALSHPSAATRARAGQVLATRGSGAIAMPLLAALESEKDPEAWEELLAALAGINAAEAVTALTRMALAPRGRFSFGGGQLKRQVAIVHALAAVNTPAARQALERIAADGDGEVKQAAGEALEKVSGEQ
jgi:HEAT repeat protein